jgi:O-succinylhomoserine sulfhydrylase
MKYHPETIAIQTSMSTDTDHQNQSSAIFVNSGFKFKSNEQARALFAKEIKGNTYGRYHNPNGSELVKKFCELEYAEDGLAVSSGMAAVFAMMATFLKSGDHIIVGSCLFGSSVQIIEKFFAQWNISHTKIDEFAEEKEWENAFQENTKLIFLETPTNPLLGIYDIKKIAKICKSHGSIFMVDNVYATPVLQNPIVLGADLVMHSTTKYTDGQGRTVGGVILGRKDLIAKIEFFVRHTGPSLSPFNSWVASKGIETLHLRMQKHCENAIYVANNLMNNELVSNLRYPHLESHPQYKTAKNQMKMGGGMISFCVGKTSSDADRFIDNLSLFSISANLGDTRSMVTHPSYTSHSSLSLEGREKMGISENLVRLSIGLEHQEDLLNDILKAIKSI